jgi:hypothetical protein
MRVPTPGCSKFRSYKIDRRADVRLMEYICDNDLTVGSGKPSVPQN